MVLRQDTYLMRRIENNKRLTLYHLGSIFAEVYYKPEGEYVHHCRTFVCEEELEEYAVYSDLPAL